VDAAARRRWVCATNVRSEASSLAAPDAQLLPLLLPLLLQG